MQSIKSYYINNILRYGVLLCCITTSLSSSSFHRKKPLTLSIKTPLKHNKHDHDQMRCTYCSHCARTGPAGLTLFEQNFGTTKSQALPPTVLHETGKKKS